MVFQPPDHQTPQKGASAEIKQAYLPHHNSIDDLVASGRRVIIACEFPHRNRTFVRIISFTTEPYGTGVLG